MAITYPAITGVTASAENILASRTANDQTAAATTEQVLERVVLTPGMTKNGTVIELNFSLTKTVTAAATTTRIRLGSDSATSGANVANNTQLLNTARPGVGDTALLSVVRIVRTSATTVRVLVAALNGPYTQSAVASFGTDVTVADMDANTTYLCLTTTNASSEVHTNQFWEVKIR